MLTARLRDNLQRVRDRITAVAEQAQRDPTDIRLIGVTKYVTADVARALFELGVSDLGESRPQELERKAATLHDLPIQWHFIGHLQRNKVKLIPNRCFIQAVDSVRLLEALQQEAERRQITWEILLEVNISGDESKHGFAPGEMNSVVGNLPKFPRLAVQGLMTMAALEGGPERAQRDFHALRVLRDELRAQHPEQPFPELSMGMSDDFEEGIREGATMIRVGSALFEGIEDGPATT